jgi:hypothetical protein
LYAQATRPLTGHLQPERRRQLGFGLFGNHKQGAAPPFGGTRQPYAGTPQSRRIEQDDRFGRSRSGHLFRCPGRTFQPGPDNPQLFKINPILFAIRQGPTGWVHLFHRIDHHYLPPTARKGR